MNFVLGLDVGKVRIGISIGSLESKLCSPLTTIKKDGAEKEIHKIILDKKISTLIIGLPLNEENQETETSKKIRFFAKKLQQEINIDIVFVDEYLTSSEAKERLHITTKDKKTRNSGIIDSMSATIILERYFAKECIILR